MGKPLTFVFNALKYLNVSIPIFLFFQVIIYFFFLFLFDFNLSSFLKMVVFLIPLLLTLILTFLSVRKVSQTPSQEHKLKFYMGHLLVLVGNSSLFLLMWISANDNSTGSGLPFAIAGLLFLSISFISWVIGLILISKAKHVQVGFSKIQQT